MRILQYLILVTGIFSISAAPNVEVIRAIPAGESVEEIRQITLTFNQKMVPLGQMSRTAQELGITVTPAIQCQWRWLDPSNLTCQLSDKERLKPANEYTLILKAGIRSAGGSSLKNNYILKFSTARPAPSYANFQTWTHPGNPQIHVSFNQSVKIENAVKLLRFDTGRQLSPVKVVKNPKFDAAPDSMGVVIEPIIPLPLDTDVQLKIGDGLESGTGPLKGSAKDIVSFRTFPAFRFAGLRCQDEEESGESKTISTSGTGECNPLGGVTLLFTAPILKEELKEKLKVIPPLSAKGKEEEVWDQVYSESHLSEPHQAGRLYEVSLPRFLLARKVYQLKGSGLRDQFNRELQPALDFKFKTAARRPSLRLHHAESVLEKDEKTDVPAYVTNLKTVEIAFDRRTASGVTANQKHTIKIPKFEDNSFAIPLEVRAMSKGTSAIIEGVVTTNPSTSENAEPPHLSTQVTPYQVIGKAGHLASLVWVTDLKTGAPVEKAKITVRIQPENSVQLGGPFATATTDATGVAKLSGYVTWPPLPQNHNYAIEVIKEKDISLLPLTYSYTNGNYGYYHAGYEDYGGEDGYDAATFGTAKWAYVTAWGTTAQGLYKPGEKVQFKYYVRDQSVRHYVRAPKETYSLIIKDPKGDEVFKKDKIRLNEFGAGLGSYQLPATAAVGWYQILLKSSFSKRTLWPARFLVADFTPVPFKVELQLLSKRVFPGSKLTMDTFATLHAGGPYGNAPVRLNAQFQPGVFQSADPILQDFVFDSYTTANQPEILNVELKLDAKGTNRHNLDVNEQEHTFGTITVEAAVQDDRGKNSAARASVVYSGLDRRVGLKQTSWDNRAGEKTKILYAVADDAGKPAAGTKVVVEFQREDVKVAKVKGAGNAYLSEYTVNWEKAGECKGTSGEKPSGCDFVPKKPGTYKAIASITDKKGREHSVTTVLYVSGPGEVTWASDDQQLTIIPQKKEYVTGETAKFLVQNPFPGARALITIERLGVMKSWTMEMKDSAVLVEVPIEDDYVPGFTLGVAITSPRVQRSEPLGQIDLGKPAARFGSVRIDVNDPYKIIQVETKLDKPEYRPRDKVKVELKAQPAHPNTPQEPIELAVVVIDEAVLNLIQGHEAYFDVYKGFYKNHAWDVQTYNLLNVLIGRQKFEKKGANSGGAGGLSGPITMRELIKYVAYWNPTIKPGKDGIAKFEFTLPDNLTGWRVLTLAVTPTDRMGLGQGQFKSNKPTEIRPVLPNQVTEGDQFQAGFSILNRTDKARKVSYRIEAEGQVAGDKMPTSEGVAELNPFERKTVFLNVKTATIPEVRGSTGQIKFQVRAGDALDKDGLIHALSVNKKRSYETAAAYGTTTENKVTESILFPKNIYTDSGRVSVTLAPSVIGNVEGAFRYIKDYPHQCWEQKIVKATMASHFLRLKNYVPNVEWPGAKAMPQDVLNQAANYQAPNGGMTYWLPNDLFVSPYLSAFTAVAFAWLREAGYKVPEDVESRLHGYLNSYLRTQVQTTFFDEGMRSTVRAVALYALAVKNPAAMAGEVKRFLPAMPSMSLFGQSHYMMATLLTGSTDTERDKTLRAILNKSSQTSGKFSFNETLADGYHHLLSTPIRDNCAVLSALVKSEKQFKDLVSDIPFRLVRSLTQSRGGRDHFENTQENLFCLQALIDYSKVYEAQKPAFKVTARMDGKPLGTASFDSVVNPLKVLERLIRAEDPGRKATVELERSGQGRLYYATRLTYAPREENADNLNSGIDVKREYYVERGGKWQLLTNTAQIKRGELVKVDLFVSVPTARNFVAVSDPVPGGLEPVNRDLADASLVDANKGAFDNNRGSIYWSRGDWYEFDLQWSRFYHQELKHDFVRYYSDYLAPGSYHLSYTAQAIAVGEFSAGPTHGEEMYDPDVFGKSKPARFTVQEK